MDIQDIQVSGMLVWKSRLIEVRVPVALLFLDTIDMAKDTRAFWLEAAQNAEAAGMKREATDFRQKAREIEAEIKKAEAAPDQYRLQLDEAISLRTSIKPWQVNSKDDLDAYVRRLLEHTSSPQKGEALAFHWIVDAEHNLDGVSTLFATADYRDALSCTGKVVRGVLVDQAHLEALNRAAHQKFGR